MAHLHAIGFNEDTRAVLTELVADHRLNEDDVREVAIDLTYNWVKAPIF